MHDEPLWAWITFGALLSTLLALDLFLHRGGREASRRAALVWTVIWIGVGLAFAGVVWCAYGGERAMEYVAAYTIEKSLSLDNLFVFLIVFKSLRIRAESQRIALSWGVIGALVFRGIFIFLGAAVLERWDWVAYLFGALLLVASWRAFLGVPKEEQENAFIGFLSRHLPVTRRTDHDAFFVREEGRLRVTPLLIAVLALELTDILFAVDSVPAALAVSRNEFVVYSSNAFAILGLRSLYIVMAQAIGEMRYLHYGLGAVLAFAGLKLILAEWVHVSAPLSVGILVFLIGVPVLASVRGRAHPRVPEP